MRWIFATRILACWRRWTGGVEPGKRAATPGDGRGKSRRGRVQERLGQRQISGYDFSPGRAESYRYLGPQARRAIEYPRRIQNHQIKGSRHLAERSDAQAGGGNGQGDADSLDELHAGGAVQSHGGHLPDDDRVDARPRFAVGAIGTARARRFSALRLGDHSVQAVGEADAAVCDDAAAIAGKQRGGQRRDGWIFGAGV